MSRFSVALSPFFGGDKWEDELSGIVFEKDPYGQLKVHSVPLDVELSNIIKAIRLNVLILVDGSLEELEKKQQEKRKKEEEAVKKADKKEEAKKKTVKKAEKKEEEVKKEAVDAKEEKTKGSKSRKSSKKK